MSVDPATCEHGGLFWYSHAGCTNEEGWRCVDCDLRPGEPPGYSPAHDVSHLRVKVWSILHDLVDAHVINVSNGCHGESLTDAIARTVEASGNLDQYSIVLAIMQASTPGHAAFWRARGEAIRSGKDDRERCACGVLACVYQGGHRSCGKHTVELFADDWDEAVKQHAARAEIAVLTDCLAASTAREAELVGLLDECRAHIEKWSPRVEEAFVTRDKALREAKESIERELVTRAALREACDACETMYTEFSALEAVRLDRTMVDAGGVQDMVDRLRAIADGTTTPPVPRLPGVEVTPPAPPRPARCRCNREAGDSACDVHPSCDGCGAAAFGKQPTTVLETNQGRYCERCKPADAVEIGVARPAPIKVAP